MLQIRIALTGGNQKSSRERNTGSAVDSLHGEAGANRINQSNSNRGAQREKETGQMPSGATDSRILAPTTCAPESDGGEHLCRNARANSFNIHKDS